MDFSSRGATQRCIRSLLSQAAFQVILSPIKECFAAAANITSQGLGRILNHDLLKKSMQGKACQCLVVSLILVNSLLGSMEAERSWILPTCGTAHKSAWHKDVSVSHFLQCYLRCDRIRKDPVLVQAVQGHIRNKDSRTVYFSCRENWLYHKQDLEEPTNNPLTVYMLSFPLQ